MATRNSRGETVGMWEEPVLCQSALFMSHCPKLDQLGSGAPREENLPLGTQLLARDRNPV